MKKRQISMLLLAAMTISAAACANNADPSTDKNDSDTSVSNAVESTDITEYDYSDKNFDGYTFRVLSIADAYSMHMEFDRDEINGETLNDAIYERNRLVESKLNIKIEENVIDGGNFNASAAQIVTVIKQSVEAEDDICDISFIPPNQAISLVTIGYFHDLLQYDGFQLDKPWYNQSYNDAVTLSGKLFFGMSDATVGLTDGIWAIFFNEDMMENYSLDMPYDLVRTGKWTVDKLNEYVSAAALLNGDDSYAWNKNGSCIYGIAVPNASVSSRMMNAMGEWYVENDGKQLNLTLGSERFYRAYERLSILLTQSNGNAFFGSTAGDYDADIGGYMYPFSVGRSLFETCEICKTQGFRDFDFAYGLLPFPKLDETQERYYSTIFQGALAFSIPVTCKTPDKSAEIFDAFAYEGMKSVVPVYRSVTLEQKGLRNDDSIEMLGIITNAAVCDAAGIFKITYDFANSIHQSIYAQNDTAASLIAKHKSTISAAIESISEQLSEIK